MSVSYDHNLNTIVAAIEKTIEGISLQGSVGTRICRVIAEGIQERTRAGYDEEGRPFIPNAMEYAEEKAATVRIYVPGEYGGHMTEIESLIGYPVMTEDSITMEYGRGQPAQSQVSRKGYFMPDYDMEITDKEKAAEFSERRRFYALDDDIIDDVMEVVYEEFTDSLMRQL